MAIKNVGVVGCGLMGHGITQIAAQAGYDVIVRDVSKEKLDSGLGRISKQLSRAVEKGRMEQSQADEVTGRIKPTLEYGDFADCDLVIEAITEDLDTKLAMWRELDQIDTAMKGGANHPMGPFELLDFVGLDTTQSVGEIMFGEFREKRFAPPPTLRKLVTAGRLGRKTGSGFYDYSRDEPVPIDHESD